MLELLKGATTSASGDEFKMLQLNDGRKAVIYADGTFDGCTITTEISYEGGDWTTLPDAVFTAAGGVVLNGGGFDIRGTVSSAGSSTAVNLRVIA